MSWQKILLTVVAVLLVGGGIGAWYLLKVTQFDIYVPLYASNCASCHGDDLQGTHQGQPLVGRLLPGGDSVADLQRSIGAHAEFGLPIMSASLSQEDIKGLAIYVGERRMGQKFLEFQFSREIKLPEGVLTSDVHSFVVRPVASGLDPLIFSIEPLPDGSILVSEKERGLSIVDPAGVQGDLIQGTPATGGSMDIYGVQYGSGWLLDVAIHPDYEQNGWVYLHYTDLCESCGGLMASSMNRLDRGRIVDGHWVDVQTIWQAPREFYTATPDTGAGGRIAFDGSGHVYISVGIKSAEEGGMRDTSPQDLGSPYGKIHRVYDDGTVPPDNPFVTGSSVSWEEGEFTRQSIWTYGHRSPQGLEWHPERQRIWNSEMGPRGGDELNELLPGRNYGWPYHSLGLEYAGSAVERYKLHALEFDSSKVEQTLVDITPSPGISSFAFYTGTRFPAWRDNVLIGSLKGSSLYRMVFEDNKLVHRETLIKDLARIRDVEIGFDGLVYLLLENKSGSMIVKLVPRDNTKSTPDNHQQQIAASRVDGN